MTPFDGDISQVLKWSQNKAAGLQALLAKKSAWYAQYNSQFWADWESSVFDLRTANNFGIMVWCIILGVPATNLGLYPNTAAWAFGANRENFVASDSSVPNPSSGGNFYGGDSSTVGSIDEIRKLLQLRYVYLTSRVNLAYINYMLRFIFNAGEPWDFANGKYVYAMDSTGDPTSTIAPPTSSAFKLEYRFGPAMGLSSQFINLLNDDTINILPAGAGVKAIAVQE